MPYNFRVILHVVSLSHHQEVKDGILLIFTREKMKMQKGHVKIHCQGASYV